MSPAFEAPRADKIFDDGWITFPDIREIRLTPDLFRAIMDSWGLPTDPNVGSFTPQQRKYLEYHRGHVYRTDLETRRTKD